MRHCAQAVRLQPPRKIYDVKVEYPQAAQEARITGVVTIEATVGVDGTITDAQVLKGVRGTR